MSDAHRSTLIAEAATLTGALAEAISQAVDASIVVVGEALLATTVALLVSHGYTRQSVLEIVESALARSSAQESDA